ncbi:MAG: hypothetical protein EPN85_00235 [Bacteroidetes bacterium]|nr:MAG: hypothetical protein EPN85_00235 [Bacteroidota bacterium]
MKSGRQPIVNYTSYHSRSVFKIHTLKQLQEIIYKILPASAIIRMACVFAFFSTNLNAQEVKYQKDYSVKGKNIITEFDEQKQREMLKADGIPAATIDKIIAERKSLIKNGRTIQWTQLEKQKNPIPFAACSDMGVENGWGAWIAATGNIGSGTVTITPGVGTPIAPRFNLTGGAGIDPCTPGVNPGDPPVPVVAPGFGNASIQLGQPQTNGIVGGCTSGCVEQLTYPLTVAPNDTNFIYAYSVFLDEPDSTTNPHLPGYRPFVSLCVYDQAGTPIPCACFTYTAYNLSGFYEAICPSTSNGAVWYKPWTVVGVNLSAYVNQILTVVVTNADCGLGGHFAQSYWDFHCPPLSGAVNPFCLGQQTTIVGPASDPFNPYTYTWYQNKQLYTGLPNASSQSITPIPKIGDVFAVYVQQGSGCNFWMPFTPQPMDITSDFTSTGVCGTMTFTDISIASTGSPVVAWNWSFPGGTPTSSAASNPGIINYPPGTYTVTLIVTSTEGCIDTMQHSFSMIGFPTAAITPTAPCLGVATTLTDGSVAVSGDPIASWNWSMPGGTPASYNSTSTTSHNTATTYATAGTHIVALVVTSAQGCKDTVLQQVIVYNPPVANFSAPDKGCAPVCVNYTNLSTSTDGTINNWQWSFPGGTPTSSVANDPQNICYYTPGSYNVSLIVTTNYGCKDTIALPMVEVYPWPKAEFCVAPTVAPTTNPVFTFCDLWSTDVVSWSWNFGDNDSDFVNTDPVHSYSATATENDFYAYNICIRVQNQYGCWDTTCKVVELVPEYTFYIPNTFTPNGDFMNELFYGKSRGVKEYNIWLFDRWGNQLWDCYKEDKNTNWDSDATVPKQEGLSSSCKWDGVVAKGGMDMSGGSKQFAQEDVYVWKVRLTDIFDRRHTYIGHVNIVR